MQLAPKNSVRADKIVQAAGQLFASQGYHRTSTREIAHLADVSENTLFRYFECKEDLFWSSLRLHSAGLRFRADLLEGIANCDSPEVVLPKLLELLADTVSYRPVLLQLIAVAFVELHWKAEAFFQEHLSPVLSAINQYFKINIESGKIRDLDPTMLTAALMTMAVLHPGVYRLIDADRPALSGMEAGRAYSRFWLSLLAPRMSPYPWPITAITEKHSG